jgi:hypothetical protein
MQLSWAVGFVALGTGQSVIRVDESFYKFVYGKERREETHPNLTGRGSRFRVGM